MNADDDTAFWTTENELILSRRERFSWTVNGQENPVVPCTNCGSLELKIDHAHIRWNGVDVLLACRTCGARLMHLGITERRLHLGSSFVTVTTD